MNTTVIKGAAIAVMILFFVSVSSVVHAASYYEEYTWADKLKRGVVNIITAPVEIVRGVHLTSLEENVGYGITVGLGKGILRTGVRIGAGIVELGTFPFDWPDILKDPLIEPEYVWQEWEEWAT